MKKLLSILVMMFLICLPVMASVPPVEEQLKSWPKNQTAKNVEYIFKDLSAKFKKVNWNDRKTALSAPTAIGKYLISKYYWPEDRYYTNVFGTHYPFQIHYVLVQLKDKTGFVWELKYWIVKPYDVE